MSYQKFNPNDYEKEIYHIKLVNGTETFGYPNAGKMLDMVHGGNLAEEQMLEVKPMGDEGWEILMNIPLKGK